MSSLPVGWVVGKATHLLVIHVALKGAPEVAQRGQVSGERFGHGDGGFVIVDVVEPPAAVAVVAMREAVRVSDRDVVDLRAVLHVAVDDLQPLAEAVDDLRMATGGDAVL